MGLMIQKERATGRNSLKRIAFIIGGIALTIGFGFMGYKGKLTYQMFYAYPIGLVLLYAPQLAVTLLKIWKGVPDSTSPQAVSPAKEGDI